MVEQAAHRALLLFGDHHADPVDALDQRLGVRNDGNGVFPGDSVFVVQEFTLQPAADQLGVAHLKEDVALAQGHGGQIFHISADVLDLVEGAARRHEGEGAAVDLFQGFPPDSQAESVHSHHGQALVGDLEQGAGVDGAALVGGDGEGRLFDHGPQQLLLDGDGKIVLHLGQLRIIGGGETQDVKIRIAAGEVDHLFFIRGKGDDVVRHPADDVAEQAGVQDDLAGFGHIG